MSHDLPLFLMFNTFSAQHRAAISTEDVPVTVRVDSIEHAKEVCTCIGYDRLQMAEVFDMPDDLQARTLYVLQGSGLVNASHIPLF